ncbi:hypothetical protein E2C01_060900 [Portunus trituberculatus]|uniref:Uncharacterized protein n=1 Tax=Portunus trituberculatus TaxID=210409 RepID=A0A5B7HAB2_PORTR|nr:hypothetical protein [Portunus trituberculatus]
MKKKLVRDPKSSPLHRPTERKLLSKSDQREAVATARERERKSVRERESDLCLRLAHGSHKRRTPLSSFPLPAPQPRPPPPSQAISYTYTVSLTQQRNKGYNDLGNFQHQTKPPELERDPSVQRPLQALPTHIIR